MPDTQWPRFQVFQQSEAGQAHQNCGSVHAPDGEMALLIARDVFVRRPACVNLWVAPAERILSKTAQELATLPRQAETIDPPPPAEPYYVFQKLNEAGTHVYTGAVEAHSPTQALQRAVTTFSAHKPLVWWVCPARAVIQSDPHDVESMFEPAFDKTYRDQADYHTVSLMRQVKRATAQAGGEQ